MIYYLSFGPLFYRLPKGHQNDSLGYGYLLDPGLLCDSYKTQNICKGDTECEAQVYDKPLCIKSVNNWLDDVNSKCNLEVNELESCIETEGVCRSQQHRFLHCESTLQRPTWLSDQSLLYLERIKGPKLLNLP